MKAGRFWRVILWVWGINFGAFLASTLVLGGDAVSGYRTDDRYYLGYKRRFTEVSRGVWLYSRAHVYGLGVNHLAAMVALVMLDRIRRRDARFPPAGHRVALAAAGNEWACVHVRNRVQPVLYAAREGAAWSFGCGRAHGGPAEWGEVPVADLALVDPTLASILDLRGGFEAVRPCVGGPWTRRRIPRARVP